MRKENSNFETRFLSEAGKKLENKDYFAFVEEEDFACWVMASGIDESETQNSAEIVVKSVLDSFVIEPSITKKSLAKLIKEANDMLQYESVTNRLQASIMIVVTDYMSIRWASAGNVHLQCINNNTMRFHSKDQSYFQEMVDKEIFPLDRSLGFEERSNLTSYLGMPEKLKPFISDKKKLKELDSLIMTTVGMWEHVTDIEIIDAMQEAKSSQEVIDNLEDLLLSKQPETLANYTVAIIMVNKLFERNKDTLKKVKKIVMIAIPLVILVGMVLFIYHRNSVKRAEQIAKVENLEKKGDQFVKDENFKRALEKYDEALKAQDSIKKYDPQVIEIKQKMAQLLVDASASAEKDEIEKAKKMYVEARNLKVDHEKILEIFNPSFLTEKLSYLDSKIYISDLEKLGDTQTEAEQYADAQETYKKAKLAAIGINDQDSLKDLTIKMGTAKSMQDLADKDKTKADADKEASQAAQDTANNSNEDAAGRYDDIADQYDEAGFPDKASQMRAKAEQIREANQKANNGKQESVAAQLEEQGDASLALKQYVVAMEYYVGAQKIYQDIKNDARVTQVQRKIDTLNNLKVAEEQQKIQSQQNQQGQQNQQTGVGNLNPNFN